MYFVTASRNESRFHSLQGFFFDSVWGSYSPVFRRVIGGGVWVGAVIGVNSEGGVNILSARHTNKCFHLPAYVCEAVGPNDDPLSRWLRAEILPEGGGADPSPPILGFFNGKIKASCSPAEDKFIIFYTTVSAGV